MNSVYLHLAWDKDLRTYILRKTTEATSSTVHRSPVDFPHKGTIMENFDICFAVSLKLTLSKWPRCCGWQWRSLCDVTLMLLLTIRICFRWHPTLATVPSVIYTRTFLITTICRQLPTRTLYDEVELYCQKWEQRILAFGVRNWMIFSTENYVKISETKETLKGNL